MTSTNRPQRVALLLIDLQRSFTEGCWRQYLTDEEVAPVKEAFGRCAALISRGLNGVNIMTTRCSFPAKDFELVDDIAQVFPPDKPYLLKNSTNVMHATGFREWVQDLLKNSVNCLVMGGCTTTSCVRVSSSRTQNAFGKHGLQVVVDLNLCGARSSNYVERCPDCLEAYMLSGGCSTCSRCKDPSVRTVSPVGKAVEDMRQAGVTVVDTFDWTPYLTS